MTKQHNHASSTPEALDDQIGSLRPIPLGEARETLLSALAAERSTATAVPNPDPDYLGWLDELAATASEADSYAALHAVTVDFAPYMDSEWIVSPVIPGVWVISAPTFYAAVATVMRGPTGYRLRRTPPGISRFPEHLTQEVDRDGFRDLEAAVSWFLRFMQRDDSTIYETNGPWSKATTVQNPRPGVIVESIAAPRIVEGSRVLWASGPWAVLRTLEPAHPEAGGYALVNGSPAAFTVIAGDLPSLADALSAVR